MNVIDYADWSSEQLLVAFTALKAHDVRHTDHPLRRTESMQLVVQRIMSGELRAALVSGYLVVYSVAATWCTAEPLLYELLVLRVDDAADFGQYIAGLHALASRFHCTGIATGNGVLRPGLRRLYERHGFGKFNEMYFKEV